MLLKKRLQNYFYLINFKYIMKEGENYVRIIRITKTIFRRKL